MTSQFEHHSTITLNNIQMAAVIPVSAEMTTYQPRLNSPMTQPESQKHSIVQHEHPKNVEHYRELRVVL